MFFIFTLPVETDNGYHLLNTVQKQRVYEPELKKTKYCFYQRFLTFSSERGLVNLAEYGKLIVFLLLQEYNRSH